MNDSIILRVLAYSLTLVLTAGEAAAQRNVVVISDTHMGVGRAADGTWDPTEDFRWPDALDGFLSDISLRLPGTDLVLAGDVLELWQPRSDSVCVGESEDLGCTVEEMEEILDRSLNAHTEEIRSMELFASRDGNCIVFVPGNHDAVLVIDSLWERLRIRFSDTSCVERAAKGIWQSDTGKIVVEHGHQMGSDSNAYRQWPDILHEADDAEYIERPWGEQFVQALFNDEEAALPLIDNLTPHSAGVRYKIADRGFTGSAHDIATFLRFNLLETSLRQKIAILGEDEREGADWDLDRGRGLGHRLFLGSLDPTDPFAVALRKDDDDAQLARLRSDLDELAATLPDNEVRALCDQLAIREFEPDCTDQTLGASISGLLFSREHITGKHVKSRSAEFPVMELFIYGHTHAFELRWSTRINEFVRVDVINTGAFQRLVDDERLREIAAASGRTPIELLKEGNLESLDACYTFAEIPGGDNRAAELRAWFMEEGSGHGEVIDPCDARCPNSGAGCAG